MRQRPLLQGQVSPEALSWTGKVIFKLTISRMQVSRAGHKNRADPIEFQSPSSRNQLNGEINLHSSIVSLQNFGVLTLNWKARHAVASQKDKWSERRPYRQISSEQKKAFPVYV